MSTITEDQRTAIATQLAGRHIPSGLGTKEEACSVAAINLALTGELTDTIPECMSEAVGRWIISIQDAMPDEIRNSDGWRELLPSAAGTGRAYEAERLEVILDWMWGTVLPIVQPIADEGGYGDTWRAMCEQRTHAAANTAAATAAAAAAVDAYAAAAAYDAVDAYAAAAAYDAAYDATDAAAYAAAYAAASAAAAATAATTYAAAAYAWDIIDPVETLRKLVEIRG